MTNKQIQNYNRMLLCLKQIKQYQTLKQLQKSAKNMYGLSYEETIEMAYENVIETAKSGCKGISKIT